MHIDANHYKIRHQVLLYNNRDNIYDKYALITYISILLLLHILNLKSMCMVDYPDVGTK